MSSLRLIEQCMGCNGYSAKSEPVFLILLRQNQLVVGAGPILQTSVSSGTLGFPKENQLQIIKLKQKVKKDSERYSVRLFKEFNESVTHLIYITGSFNKVLVVASGFFHSFKWIEQCLAVSKFVNEEPFEIQGDTDSPHSYAPRTSRMSRIMNQPPLFTNLTVFIVGDIALMDRKEFIQIIETVGVNITIAPGAEGSSEFATQSLVRPVVDITQTPLSQLVFGYEITPLLRWQGRGYFVTKACVGFTW
eukprot:sb/3468818/